MAPWGTFAVANSRPPWASMIERQIESPIPMPLDLVVKKALKSRSAFSAEMPTPQSVTLTSTCCIPSWRDRITSSRGRSVTDCIASMPFITRLIITCCSWTRSPRIMGRGGANSVRNRPHAPNHLPRPIAVIDNPFHRAARCVQVGNPAVEPAQTGLGVGDDAGARLGHFVGERSRQLAQGCYAHNMRQIRVRLAQCLLDVLALCQIEHKGDALVLAVAESR